MALMPDLGGKGWVNTDKPGGSVFFVGGGTVAYRGKGGSNDNDGRTPQNPLSTIAQGILNTVTGRGDTIVLLPGGETITTALAMSNDDVTITGVDPNGSKNPSAITINAAIDGINVTGAGCTIENLHFPAGTSAANTSNINIAAAGATIRNCTFNCGAQDLETITVTSDGDDLTIKDCKFYVTANGPDAAIEIEDTSARLTVKDCTFWGGDDTNKWDVAAIASDAIHTECLILRNTSFWGVGIDFDAAATGIIAKNYISYHGGTLGSLLDPGSCHCYENYEADAVDERGSAFPTSAAS